MPEELLQLSGVVDGLGDDAISFHINNSTDNTLHTEQLETSKIRDHETAFTQIFCALDKRLEENWTHSLIAISHRVVHGGNRFTQPAAIDKTVIEEIRKAATLAPLHNKISLQAIETIQQLYPGIIQIAVFDTAFFGHLPAHAYRYALPNDLYTKYNIRRYGFHGTSHQYVSDMAAKLLEKPLQKLKLITLHLGNGASAAAILNGQCIDTSMGMSPLEGLIMGTRCGDIDPSLPFYLNREAGLEFSDIESLLNHDSGMLGLCGTKDMRDIHRLADDGNAEACLALDMYCYRIRKYIGSYYTILGGLDALIFTGGVGENDARIRDTICKGLTILGISLDQEKNLSISHEPRRIDSESGKTGVFVIPTNESLEITRQSYSLLQIDSRE